MASVRLVKNVGLGDPATSTQTSSVGEPTAAAAGDDVFVTGNWFASRSTNGGAGFTLVDPFTALPAAAGGFCCDQLVLYERSRAIWIWILQYTAQDGGNVFRVAISRAAAFGSWHWWDFSPTMLDASWTDLWFDYPDAAVSASNLFVTFNGYDAARKWKRAFAFKLPLDTLRDSGRLDYQWWSTTANGSLRLTQGAAATMYFASHNGGTRMRVHSWPDASSTVSSFEVRVRAYSAGPYSAPGPDGAEWLGRTDPRITGGWLAGNRAGFMWTAAADARRPFPYVRVAVVDTATRALAEQPDIWSSKTAYAYPAACPNAQGVVGISLFSGGGGHHPSHLVGFRDGGSWRLATTRASTNGPAAGAWGDYLACRRHEPGGADWVTAGYTLQGGTDRRSMEPQYVRFAIG